MESEPLLESVVTSEEPSQTLLIGLSAGIIIFMVCALGLCWKLRQNRNKTRTLKNPPNEEADNDLKKLNPDIERSSDNLYVSKDKLIHCNMEDIIEQE